MKAPCEAASLLNQFLQLLQERTEIGISQGNSRTKKCTAWEWDEKNSWGHLTSLRPDHCRLECRNPKIPSHRDSMKSKASFSVLFGAIEKPEAADIGSLITEITVTRELTKY